jgi:hypothetical protein
METTIQQCPICNAPGVFIPPPEIDKKRKKLIAKYKCSNGHVYFIERDTK